MTSGFIIMHHFQLMLRQCQGDNRRNVVTLGFGKLRLGAIHGHPWAPLCLAVRSP